MTKSSDASEIKVLPLTPERWEDFMTLLGPNGCAGCWCMWYRVTNRNFKELGKEGRKNAMHGLVEAGMEPGLIAYLNSTPAGWVTIAPRAEYVRLETSKVMAAVDAAPVWSIPCFFVHRKFRRRGLTGVLIRAAAEHARSKGASIIEAYPYDGPETLSAASAFMGLASTFRKLGFVEVARRAENHPVMRLELG